MLLFYLLFYVPSIVCGGLMLVFVLVRIKVKFCNYEVHPISSDNDPIKQTLFL